MRDDEPGFRLVIHDAVPRPDVGDRNPLGRQLWSVWPRFSVEPPCQGARISAGSRTLLNGRPVPVTYFEGDGYSGYTVEISARVTCNDGRHADASREFLLPPASCDGGPFRVYDIRGSAVVRDYSFADRAEPVPLAEGNYVGTDAFVEVSPGGRVELAAPECNRLRVVFGPGDYQVGSYERGGGNWFAGREIVVFGDRNGGRFFVEPEPGRPSPAHVTPLTERASSYAVRRVRGRIVVRVYEGLVGVTGLDERYVVKVGRLQQVSVLPGAARPTSPRFFQPNEPWALEPARGWARLAPRFASFSTRRLAPAAGAPEQRLVIWSRDLRTRRGTVHEQGYWIWERNRVWRRVYGRELAFGLDTRAEVGDVTGDGHDDVLLESTMGTGACGPRRLVAYAGGRTRELFSRGFCEGHAEIVGGALRVRMGVGPCPYPDASAHCFGGMSTTVLRWDGAKLISNRRSVECKLPALDPKRDCAPRRSR